VYLDSAYANMKNAYEKLPEKKKAKKTLREYFQSYDAGREAMAKAKPSDSIKRSCVLGATSREKYEMYMDIAKHVLGTHEREGPMVPHVTVHPHIDGNCWEDIEEADVRAAIDVVMAESGIVEKKEEDACKLITLDIEEETTEEFMVKTYEEKKRLVFKVLGKIATGMAYWSAETGGGGKKPRQDVVVAAAKRAGRDGC
jgi:hypothetical protein